jgi:hypothetical protein
MLKPFVHQDRLRKIPFYYNRCFQMARFFAFGYYCHICHGGLGSIRRLSARLVSILALRANSTDAGLIET